MLNNIVKFRRNLVVLKLIKSNKMEFILALLGCYLLADTYISSDWVSHYSADPIGTAAIPRFCLMLLIACSVLLLILKNKKLLGKKNKEQANEIPTLDLSQTFVFSLFALSTIAYIYSTWHIGLFVSTLIYLLIWLKVFGNSIKITFILSIAGTGAIYFLMNIAQVFLPEGLLF